MRTSTLLLLAAICFAGFHFGCERADKGSGDSHAVGAPLDAGSSDARTANNVSQGGTGNAPTSFGTGATNGVVDNETRNAVGGPGNTESGAGTSTRPAE
jgi:hypothetical protein